MDAFKLTQEIVGARLLVELLDADSGAQFLQVPSSSAAG